MVLTALACAPAPTSAVLSEPTPGPEARSRVEPPTARIAEPILWTLEAEVPDDLEVRAPSSFPEIRGLEVVPSTVEVEALGAGRSRHRLVVHVKASEVGTWALPPVPWEVRPSPEAAWTNLPTGDLLLEVVSVLPPDAADLQRRDLKPLEPRPPRVPAEAIAAAGAVAAIVAAGLAFWVWLRRPRPPSPPVAPDVAARRAFEALERADRSTPASRRAWMFRLAEVVRVYVEGTLPIRATDLTSEELAGALALRSDVPADAQEAMARFLVTADRARYAEDPADPSDADAALAAARAFVDTLDRALRPPEQTP